MPILLTKIEGKGNGIKTVLPNMADVARALSRPPACESKPPKVHPYTFSDPESRFHKIRPSISAVN